MNYNAELPLSGEGAGEATVNVAQIPAKAALQPQLQRLIRNYRFPQKDLAEHMSVIQCHQGIVRLGRMCSIKEGAVAGTTCSTPFAWSPEQVKAVG